MRELETFALVLPVLVPVLTGWRAVRLTFLFSRTDHLFPPADGEDGLRGGRELWREYEEPMADIVTITTLSMVIVYPIFYGSESTSGRL